LFIDAGGHRGWWYTVEDNFDSAISRVEDVLSGLIEGTCRIAETWQFGKVKKTAIEQFSNGKWKPVSVYVSHFTIPFFARHIVYVQNQINEPAINNQPQMVFVRQANAIEADPNTAEPVVKIVGNDILLTYDLKNWSDDEAAIIRFHDVLIYRIGDPNDEGFYGDGEPRIRNDSMYSLRRFPHLEFWNFYEVVGFDWKSGLIGSEVYVIDQDFQRKTDYRHFVFFMKDGTFECVCQSWEQLPNSA
jgi:hypothetical protein